MPEVTLHHLDHAIDHTRERVTTVCTCGRWMVATPTPDQEPHVVGELGYPDVWQACLAHDPMHST